MPAKKLSVRKIKEVLRSKLDVGLGLRQIARSCSIGLGTTHEYLQRAEAAKIPWPLGPEWDDGRLEARCSAVRGLGRNNDTACYQLYVILDVFSRFVVGWMIAYRESAELAKRLIEHACRKQLIAPGQLTIHADRGSSMKSKPVALLLADLGVTKTHSRPHVSDDNPYSESQFRTLKYRPGFPDRFGSIEDARGSCQSFFRWYNYQDHHSGLGLMTPAVVHLGKAADLLVQRQAVLNTAFQAHPERFVHQPPKPPSLPTAVWINKPEDKEKTP